MDISFTQVTDQGLHQLAMMATMKDLYIGATGSTDLLEWLQQAKSGMFIHIYRQQDWLQEASHY